MQTLVRYNVINQDGRPVIRAVQVPRRLNESLVETAEGAVREPQTQATTEPLLRRIRRLRLLDIR